MPINVQDRADVGSMVGPTVTLKTSSEGMSVELTVPLGSAQGGVWPNPHTVPESFGWTCPACQAWMTHYRSDVQAYGALRHHEGYDCLARRDGGEQW